MVNKQNTSRFEELIQYTKGIEFENILLFSHISPDPDAITSTLGMYYLLSNLFNDKNIKVTIQGSKMGWMDDLKGIEDVVFEEFPEKSLVEDSLIVFLDGNSADRFFVNPSKFNLEDYYTICVDHHKSESDDWNLNISNVGDSSAAKLVAELLLDSGINIPSEIAELLLIGIASDTGTFRYLKPTDSDTLVIVSKLLQVSKKSIQELEYFLSVFTKETFEVYKILLESVVNIERGELSYSMLLVPENLSDRFSIESIETAINKVKFEVIRYIEGYKWGVTVRKFNDATYKLSFRSTPGSVNVRLIAEELNGGGHDLAAGAKISAFSIMEAKEKVQDLISSLELKIVND